MGELIWPEQLKGNDDELRLRYSHIFFERYRYIDDSEYLLVDDISKGKLNELPSYCPGVEVLDLQPLVEDTLPYLRAFLSEYIPEEVAMVYPGGGGRRVYSAMPTEITAEYSSTFLDMQRKLNPLTGLRESAMNEEQRWKLYEATRYKKAVIVADDAINKGGTLLDIRKGQADITWIALAPIILSPLPKKDYRPSPSSLEGYTAIIATEILEGAFDPVPFNFVSSLIKGNLTEDTRIRQYLLGRTQNEEDSQRILDLLFHNRFQ